MHVVRAHLLNLSRFVQQWRGYRLAKGDNYATYCCEFVPALGSKGLFGTSAAVDFKILHFRELRFTHKYPIKLLLL